MSKAVLDAGPLIHLAELKALDVLYDFDTLLLPETVGKEVAKYQRSALKYPNLKLSQVRAPGISTDLIILAQAFSLDQGEIEALAILELYPGFLFLTDDAAARLAAAQRGYSSHGTIGLLIRSVRVRRRTPDSVLKLLKDISRHSTLHIRPALMTEIVQRLEKEWAKSGD